MKERTKGAQSLKKWVEKLERYRYALLVILVGAVLLLWPGGGEERVTLQEQTQAVSESFDLSEVERKLSAALSKVEGAGEVSVLLTVKNSSRSVLAEDRSGSEREGKSETAAETVVISSGSGRESPVLVEQIYPEYQGALVVSTGSGDAQVRWQLAAAVSALTGLGTDQICICQGK